MRSQQPTLTKLREQHIIVAPERGTLQGHIQAEIESKVKELDKHCLGSKVGKNTTKKEVLSRRELNPGLKRDKLAY